MYQARGVARALQVGEGGIHLVRGVTLFFQRSRGENGASPCFHILPPVSLTQVANIPPISTTLAKLVEKFAAGDVDTGGAP